MRLGLFMASYHIAEAATTSATSALVFGFCFVSPDLPSLYNIAAAGPDGDYTTTAV
jgi:hypothetical protein